MNAETTAVEANTVRTTVVGTTVVGTKAVETTVEDLGSEITRADFLGLTPEDEAIVSIRLALHRKLKETRERSGLTQTALAQRIGSSQSRVAKAEAGDASISLELLIRATVAGGASALEIADAIRATQLTKPRNKLTKPKQPTKPKRGTRKRELSTA